MTVIALADRVPDAGVGRCYHCAAPMPAQGGLAAMVAGVPQPMCCPGCAAVAALIEETGMSGYYRARTEPGLPAGGVAAGGGPGPADTIALALFDDAQLQTAFVEVLASGEAEAHLQLHHLRCGACHWLIEHQLRRQPGVRAVDIHPLAGRLVLRWQPAQTTLSALVAALRAVGYNASPWLGGEQEKRSALARRRVLAELVVAGLGMMQVMMYAVPVYLADAGDISVAEVRLMDWAGLVLTLPVMLFSARGIFQSAWQALRRRQVGMDTPVALGLLAAFLGSLVDLWRGSGPVWFDSITMFVFLLLATRWLERSVRQRALDASARLAPAVPAQTLRVDAQGKAEAVAVVTLQPGDCVRVVAGAAIPVDGRIRQGAGPVAEALLTGESRPHWRSPGDRVLAGSLNLEQVLDVEVLAVGAQSVLARVLRRMDQAMASRAPVSRLADRVASRFVSGLLLLTLASVLFWLVWAPERALQVAIAVLVVSCPCALSLAVPATLAASAARLARRGMLLMDGDALETLAGARTVVFDKTGTLTDGIPHARLEWRGQSSCERLQLAAVLLALEAQQLHPFAQAICRALGEEFPGLAPAQLDARLHHLGQGVEARHAGVCWRIGKPGFAMALLPAESLGAHRDVRGDADDPGAAHPGSRLCLCSSAGHLLSIGLQEAPRPAAAALVRDLQAQDIAVVLLSGDAPAAAARLGHRLGIVDARGGLSPGDKQAMILALQAAGPVVMVGDGLNDAPGFGSAHLAIAIGQVSEALGRGAGAMIPSGDLAALQSGVREARGAWRRMRQNLGWALCYNLAAIPLAASGALTPWQAGLGMSLSSLLVVLNGMRPWKS